VLFCVLLFHSCIFMSCKLVHHFHVQHFQRPRFYRWRKTAKQRRSRVFSKLSWNSVSCPFFLIALFSLRFNVNNFFLFTARLCIFISLLSPSIGLKLKPKTYVIENVCQRIPRGCEATEKAEEFPYDFCFLSRVFISALDFAELSFCGVVSLSILRSDISSTWDLSSARGFRLDCIILPVEARRVCTPSSSNSLPVLLWSVSLFSARGLNSITLVADNDVLACSLRLLCFSTLESVASSCTAATCGFALYGVACRKLLFLSSLSSLIVCSLCLQIWSLIVGSASESRTLR